MDKAQTLDFDPRNLDFSSLDVWEKIWKMFKGSPEWHGDFVDAYVDYHVDQQCLLLATFRLQSRVWSA